MTVKGSSTIIFGFAAALVVYVTGMFTIAIMDIDASLYAEMSREMLGSCNLLDFRNRLIDRYLDKPPLLFWLSTFSYTIFGVSEFAYRLPTFLSTLLGTWSVYRMTLLYYKEKQTAYLAAFILFTCQAWFLVNHDVRTDTLLANMVIFASWQIAEYLQRRKALSFLLGFAGIGLAMMAKGPIGLMVPVIGFGADLIIKKRWKDIFRPEWLLGPLVILAVLSPMLLSLYRQYGTYGLEFFFWTQSFGRIFGINYWQDSSGPFFFVHTFLWSFLPWSLLTLAAFFIIFRKVVKSHFRSGSLPEYISLAGFLVTFIILSRSSYKLPHYIYVVFPYAAIFTAAGIQEIMRGSVDVPPVIRKLAGPVQYFLSGIMLFASFILSVWIFPFDGIVIPAALLVFASVAYYILVLRGRSLKKWFLFSAFAVIVSNFTLNLHVYPSLMEYQAGRKVAAFINDQNIPHNNIYLLNYHSSAFDFYLGSTPPEINARKAARLAVLQDDIWIVTNEQGVTDLQNKIPATKTVKGFTSYRVQIITWKFLNPGTRNSATSMLYLVRI